MRCVSLQSNCRVRPWRRKKPGALARIARLRERERARFRTPRAPARRKVIFFAGLRAARLRSRAGVLRW